MSNPTKKNTGPAKNKAGGRARSHVAAARRGSRAGGWWTGAAVAVIVAFVAVLAIYFPTHKGASSAAESSGIPAVPITSATGRTTPPPWPAPTDVTGAVHAAGLPLLGAEGSVEHIHAHLDVIVNGHPVQVPADIGVDAAAGRISPLHTHDTSGVIHIESPVTAPFSLAQLFAEWQVALSDTHLGGLAATAAGDGGQALHVFLNGRPVTGNPGALTLGAHQEIALIYGPVPDQVPASYPWGDL